MENLLKEIEEKIHNQIKVENIQIIDNSYKHVGHKFFNKDKFHIKLKINSSYLREMNRLKAQRTIMNILKDELKKRIHALEIEII